MIKMLAHILLFLLPFHAVLSNFVRFEIGADKFWIWKELILFVILILNLGYREFSALKKSYWNLFTGIILLYGIFIAVSAIWAPGSGIGRIFIGAKFDYLMFIALFAGMSFGSITKNDFESLLRSAFFGGSLALVFGLGLHFLLGPENFTMLGYRNDWSTYLVNEGLAFCQKLEGRDICRFQGTFSGPNQAGFYLMLYLPMAYYFLKNYWENTYKRLLLIISIFLGLVALFLTFSRSAWLGFLLSLILLMVFILKKYLSTKALIQIAVGVIVLACLILFGLYVFDPDLLMRPLSTSEHITNWVGGLKAFFESPIYGLGVGTAGPASRIVTGYGLIPENWFLQVAIQYGIIGLGLFTYIYYSLLKKLFKSDNELGMVLFVVLASMLVPAMFLHVFEDSVMSYSLMFLIGSYLTIKN